MTSLPTSGQIKGVTRQIAALRPLLQFGSCAIIAPGEALFGMTRMFEVFAEEYFGETRMFRVPR